MPVLELPVDRARPVQPSWVGGTKEFSLDPELVAALERLGREHNATLYMTLLAAFQVLVGQWSGQCDFGVGTPVAGRGRPEVEGVIGLFVNTLVMRADLAGDPTFVELLARVRDHMLDALDHQDVPFEQVVGNSDRTATPPPLAVRHLFDLEIAPSRRPATRNAATLHRLRRPTPFDVTKYDLTVHLHRATRVPPMASCSTGLMCSMRCRSVGWWSGVGCCWRVWWVRRVFG